MNTVTHMIHTAAGSPPMEGADAGACRLCGASGAGLPFGAWVKDTFTDHDKLQTGTIICHACQFCTAEAAPGLAERAGKCKIGKAMPICQELIHLLPNSFQRPAPSVWEYLQEEMYTRKDDEKNENLRRLIAPDVRGLLDVEHRRQALAKAQGKAQEDTGQHQQMRYYVETFAAGTPFYWKIVLDDVTEIEFEAFITALVEFSRLPYVGGKSNVGLGEVAITFDNWMAIDSRLNFQGQAVTTPIGAAYAEHLRTNGAAIRDLLGAMR